MKNNNCRDKLIALLAAANQSFWKIMKVLKKTKIAEFQIRKKFSCEF